MPFFPMSGWRTPAPARVNRHLRNEVNPLYYGQKIGLKLLLLYRPSCTKNIICRFCRHSPSIFNILDAWVFTFDSLGVCLASMLPLIPNTALVST
ncbi:hypothetical protein F4823DRAFT_572510 [Ustulina deusta]|nr:hypothetical protein F4823DRAFT_572510 [Ustulina deusta]